MKRFASMVLAAILTLSVAGNALAATAGGSTNETLDIASNISFTAPATLAYSTTSSLRDATANLTATTDHGLGMTITVLANADGTSLIPRSRRSVNTLSATELTAATAGSVAFTATPSVIATSTGPVAAGTVTINLAVDVAGLPGGSYTGTLTWLASTN